MSDQSPEALTKAFFDTLDAVKQRYSIEDAILIRGVQRDDDDEEEEEEEDDDEEDADRVYTAEELAQLRYVLLTTWRKRMIDDAIKFVTGGQVGSMFMMFNTNSGNKVCAGIQKQVTKALKLATLPEQFDSLFALTFALDRYDDWLNDNEYWERGGILEKGLKALAKAWKGLLVNTDASLGIDPEYTRAGIEALLEDMEEKVGEQSRGGESGYEFEWR
jgi:hypothetical protein